MLRRCKVPPNGGLRYIYFQAIRKNAFSSPLEEDFRNGGRQDFLYLSVTQSVQDTAQFSRGSADMSRFLLWSDLSWWKPVPVQIIWLIGVAAFALPATAQVPDERFRHARETIDPDATADTVHVEVSEQWHGIINHDDLLSVLGERQFITNSADWQHVWTSWRPDEPVPAVVFDNELVVVLVAHGPNIPGLNGPLLHIHEGDVRVVAMSTLIGGPGFGYRLLRLPRTGILSINGVPVDELQADESTDSSTDGAHVTMVGTLATGNMAIGGETTGVTITAGDITMELDFASHAHLARMAEAFSGSRVRVTGSLRLQRGVETSDRWIIDVANLQAIKD